MTDRSFAGIPVSGDYTFGYGHKEQRTLEDFLPAFNAVVNNPHVTKFGWRQYTPYFNDGEECVFGASNVWIETDADDVDHLEDNDEYYDHDEWFSVDYGSSVLFKYDYGGQNRIYENNEPWAVELRDLASSLAKNVEGGHFDNVLLEHFGNHVEITVYPRESEPRIETEFFEHD